MSNVVYSGMLSLLGSAVPSAWNFVVHQSREDVF